MFTRNQSNNRFFRFQLFKSLLITANIFALLVSSIAVVSTAKGQSQNTNKPLPVFDVNKTEHDFGNIYLGESTAAVFTVRNLGAAPLELSENPIVPGKPTVGVYRKPASGSQPQGLRDLLVPVALFTGVPPYP
jgi:hypothetical protein